MREKRIIQIVNNTGVYETYLLPHEIQQKLVLHGYVVEKYTVRNKCDGVLSTESYWRVLRKNNGYSDHDENYHHHHHHQ